jgi:chorismate synthase
MKFEQDEVEFLGGVRHGRTLGGPVAVKIANSEWPKWDKVMAAGQSTRLRLEGWRGNSPDSATARSR